MNISILGSPKVKQLVLTKCLPVCGAGGKTVRSISTIFTTYQLGQNIDARALVLFNLIDNNLLSTFLKILPF